MIRPPPTSPLFPYTTLFRSLLIPRLPMRETIMRIFHKDVKYTRTDRCAAVVGNAETQRSLLLGILDRKSTRLNSSHVAISYAVFCLKKKTKQKTTHTPRCAH